MPKASRIKSLKNKLKEIEDGDGFVCDDQGRAIINVGAENYDDIFSPYCYKGGDTLSVSTKGCKGQQYSHFGLFCLGLYLPPFTF